MNKRRDDNLTFVFNPLAGRFTLRTTSSVDIEAEPQTCVGRLVVLLYGTLVLAERRSGYVIMLLVGCSRQPCPSCT